MSSSNTVITTCDVSEITLKTLYGDELDLLENYLTIDLYEDINSMFLHGRMTVIDNADMITRYGIVGNEEISIVFTPTGDDEDIVPLTFALYAVSEFNEVKNKASFSKIYTLSFCSKEKITDNLTKFSRKYDDNAENIVSDIIGTLLESDKLVINGAITDEPIIIYTNNRSPFEVIDHACKLSKSSEFKDFIFYEDFGGYHFDSFSNMMNQDAVDDYVLSKDMLDQLSHKTIREFNNDKYFNLLNNSKNAIYGSTLYSIDPLKYTITKTEKTYKDAMKEVTALGKFLIVDDSINSASNHIGMTWLDPEIQQVRHVSSLGRDSFLLSMRLNGTTKRKLGSVVNFDGYPIMSRDISKPWDPYFDGNWIIIAIHHIINRDGTYYQEVQVNKNAAFDVELNTLPETEGNQNP